MVFGDILRSGASPSTGPQGVGGDANTIWHCDNAAGLLYELSTTDFSVVRSAASPTVSPLGMGGKANVIYHSEVSGPFGDIYELSTADFSVVNTGSPPLAYNGDVGGNTSKVWFAGTAGNTIYELDPSDFSTVASNGITGVQAAGGDGTRIWGIQAVAEGTTYAIEIAPSDLSIVQTSANLFDTYNGIGGDANTIWGSDLAFRTINELDPGAVAPTVTTQAISDITTITATGNGNITDTGGEDCDERGFVFGTTSYGDPGNTAPVDTDYDDYVDEGGTFGTGAFTGSLTGLVKNTHYYVRAYAHNSAGYAYGGEVEFDTLNVAPPASMAAKALAAKVI